MPRKRPTDVNDREWYEAIQAITTTHSYNIKSVCRGLKCTRPWFNAYISSHISDRDKIKFFSGHRANGKNSINWLYLAKLELNNLGFDNEDYCEVWYDSQKIDNLILSNCTASQRTKVISKKWLVKEPESFRLGMKNYENLLRRVSAERDIPGIFRVKTEMQDYEASCYSDIGKMIAEEGFCDCRKRGKVEEVPLIELPRNIKNSDGRVNFDALKALHDITDYGESPETELKKLFMAGDIKVTLSIEGKDNAVSQKVYYVDDPDKPIGDPYGTKTVQLAVWNKYKELL